MGGRIIAGGLMRRHNCTIIDDCFIRLPRTDEQSSEEEKKTMKKSMRTMHGGQGATERTDENRVEERSVGISGQRDSDRQTRARCRILLQIAVVGPQGVGMLGWSEMAITL